MGVYSKEVIYYMDNIDRKAMGLDDNTLEGACACNCECKSKRTPRQDTEQKDIRIRINRIIGQLGGIAKMIDEDRYCKDVLLQISAVKSAVTNLGYVILKEHLESCVTDQIKEGNDEVYDEVMEIIKRLG